jgi:hypothetical protein
MNKYLTVGLAVLSVIAIAGQAQSEPVSMEDWQIQFVGSDGARVHGSINWTDAKNPQKPTYMETADGIGSASKRLTLPAGAILSANGSSDAIKPVIVSIYRNYRACDDNPDPIKSFSNSKTCSP